MNSRQVPFSKISRDWFLGSCLYDSIVDRDISQTIILLETKKANPNVLLPEYGISPFHLVIGSEDRKFACRATKACLLNGADPNIRSDEGLTPVHVAAMWGYTDILDVLLSAGGNPWLVDYDGKNAFQYAEEEKNWEAYTVLYNNCDTSNFSTTNTFYDIPASMEEQKNMILCRGDLCIEYDAEPMKDSYSLFHSPLHKKSVSTQTPTRRYKDAKPCSTCHVIVQDDDKNKITNTSHKDSLSVQFDWDKQVRDISIHSEALNTILNHRKKTTIYACSSKKDVYNNHRCNLEKEKHNGVESCPSQNTKKSIKNIKENFLFEFKSKIEQANKHLHDKDKNWQNIIFKTLHKKRESSALDLNHENKIQDNVCQNEPVLDSNYSESGIIYNEREEEASNLKTESYDSHLHLQSSTDESSASSYRSMQGIMKYNHTASNCDQTSIFSDIDSDISVCVVSGSFQSTKSISKMLTDDELSLSEELMPSKISVNNYFSCNENINSSTASISRTPHTTHNEFNSSENKNVYSEEAEKIQPVCIQNSRECDLTVDSNETGAVIGCEVCNDQITSCAHKWEEADVGFTSDDDKEHGISEEYVYTDEEEGIVLTEKRFGVNSVRMPILNTHRDDEVCRNITDTDSSSTTAYDTDTLRKKLSTYGFRPGPITCHTKRVYLRKLKRFHHHRCSLLEQNKPQYSPELHRVLALPNMHLLKHWSHLEEEMSCAFSASDSSISWREGLAKTSFTYLLLDPQITCNLPATARNLQLNQIWEKFLEAVFYIGKGKRSRPYSHLYQSVAIWENKHSEQRFSKKVERILEIWHSGQGVICLHVFQNIIPVEAYTREAAMISAVTLGRLTNEKSGEFYGPCANWSVRQKRQLGAVLLYRACQVFMGEGERQIRPADID